MFEPALLQSDRVALWLHLSLLRLDLQLLHGWCDAHSVGTALGGRCASRTLSSQRQRQAWKRGVGAGRLAQFGAPTAARQAPRDARRRPQRLAQARALEQQRRRVEGREQQGTEARTRWPEPTSRAADDDAAERDDWARIHTLRRCGSFRVFSALVQEKHRTMMMRSRKLVAHKPAHLISQWYDECRCQSSCLNQGGRKTNHALGGGRGDRCLAEWRLSLRARSVFVRVCRCGQPDSPCAAACCSPSGPL